MATTLDKPQAPPSAPAQAPPPPVQEPLLVQCASCGSPIAFDQTYCVECGAKNDRPGGWLSRFKTRRYVLGGLGVLLAIGGIVGYAAAAASRHDAVKVATRSVPPAAPTNQGPATAPPPATTTPPPAAGKPVTPPPIAGKPVTPPPAAKPPAAPPASHPSAPAPSAPSTPSHSSTPSTPQPAQPSNPAPAPKPAYAKLFSSGRSPVSAGPYDPNHMGGINPNGLSKVFDDDASTVWKSGTYAGGVGSGVGFYVDDGAPGSIKGLGLLTKTAGFDVQIYAYDGDTPPQALSNWTQVGARQNVAQRQKIAVDLKGQQYQLYLVWFTKLPAKGQRFELPEVQLLP